MNQFGELLTKCDIAVEKARQNLTKPIAKGIYIGTSEKTAHITHVVVSKTIAVLGLGAMFVFDGDDIEAPIGTLLYTYVLSYILRFMMGPSQSRAIEGGGKVSAEHDPFVFSRSCMSFMQIWIMLGMGSKGIDTCLGTIAILYTWFTLHEHDGNGGKRLLNAIRDRVKKMLPVKAHG